MNTNRLNLILLPLLVSILLSTLGKLKIGRTIDHLTYTILTPIQAPVSSLRFTANTNISLIKEIPNIFKQNTQLKNTNNALLTENQNLKNLIQDKSLIETLKNPYKQSIPVRVVSNGNIITVTTSLDLSSVAIGQPVVQGTTLIGIVSEIKKPIISITPLTDESFSGINLKTSLGQKGVYQYSARTPQIINIPSENPVSLNDTVFTEASDKIPANLIIGKITKILTTSQSPLQKAEIKIDTDINQIKDLLIITKP